MSGTDVPDILWLRYPEMFGFQDRLAELDVRSTPGNTALLPDLAYCSRASP
jgi:hypothetical protein